MSSPLRSCEEDEGMVVNSEGGDFDEDDEDEDGGGGGGEPDDGNASDINSPAAPRESATAVAPGTVQERRGGVRKVVVAATAGTSRTNKKRYTDSPRSRNRKINK